MTNRSVWSITALRVATIFLLFSSAGLLSSSPTALEPSTAIDNSRTEYAPRTFIESSQSSMSVSVAAYDWESYYVYLSFDNVLIYDYSVSGGNINLHLLSSGQYSTWVSAAPGTLVPTLRSISSTSSGRLTYRSSSGGEYYLLFDNQASSSSKSISGTITKDTAAPSISCNLTHGQNYTSPVTIQITASDDESSIEQIALKIDGETVASVNDADTLLYEWEVSWSDSGNYTLQITARDSWDKARTVELNVSISGIPVEPIPFSSIALIFGYAILPLVAVVIGIIYSRHQKSVRNLG